MCTVKSGFEVSLKSFVVVAIAAALIFSLGYLLVWNLIMGSVLDLI